MFEKTRKDKKKLINVKNKFPIYKNHYIICFALR